MKSFRSTAPLLAVALAACASAPPAPPPPPPSPVVAVSVASAPPPAPPRPETPDAEFRRHPPPVDPAPAVARPMPVEEARTLSGIRVLASPEAAFPIASLQLVVRWSRDTGPGEARALQRAVSRRGQGSVLSALEAVGAVALVEAHPDALHIAANLPSSELPRAVEVLGRFIAAPSFGDEDRVELGVRGVDVAEEAARLALPADHPYARFLVRTQVIKPDILLRRLRALLASDGVSVVVAGAARAGEVAALLDAALPRHRATALSEPPADRPLRPGAVLVDTQLGPDVSLVGLGPPRGHADYAAALVATSLLSRAGATRWSSVGWSSPLVTARYQAARAATPWVVSVGVAGDRVGDAAEGLLASVRELTVTDEELAAAVRPWLTWTDTLLDRQSDQAWALARMVAEGSPDPANLRAALLALRPADLRRVLDERLAKKQVRLVVRGPAKTLLAGATKAGFGAVRVVKE